MRDPVKLAGADLRLDLQTPDMARLTPLTGVPLSPTPPFRATGRLDYAAGRFRFTDVVGQVGSSDIAGAYTVSVGPAPTSPPTCTRSGWTWPTWAASSAARQAAPAPPDRPPSNAARSPARRPARG